MRNICVFLATTLYCMKNKTEQTVIKEWLIETLPYEVMWMDELGKIVYANSKLCQRLSFSKSDMTRFSIFDINVTVTKESWKNHWETVKKEKTASFKGTHKDKKGKFYEVEVFAQFFSNNGKELICAIVNDITDSSFYKNLMDSTETIANVGGWKLNLQDSSLIVTAETLKIFKTEDKDDLLPSNIIHYFAKPEEFKKCIRDAIQNTIAFDTVLETNEQPKRYIRAVGKPILKGTKVYKILGVYQDVTTQQLKENALQLYKKIIDNAKDMIMVVDNLGNLVYYSKSAHEQLGYSESEFKNFTVFDVDPTKNKESWKARFNDVVKNGCINVENVLYTKDKKALPIDVTANYLSFEDKDLNIAIIRDISERKIREQELYKALEEIKSLKNKLEIENEYLIDEIETKLNFDSIICKSDAYLTVLKKVDQVAPTDTTVLITGESGTGKELIAREIHAHSRRKDSPLIKINCATLPKELIESELFGHKKGAFTGAVDDKVGKFTLADGGTIFLDEIGELPVELQPKLLRVIQEGEFDELGGTKTKQINVRIIAATNRDLLKMVKEGTFREDLYYRLNVFPIYNIPLRARKEDIPLLAQYFLEKNSAKAGKSFKRLSKKTIEVLMEYNFPGNIRELENLIERAVIIENGTTLNPGNWIPTSDVSSTTDDFKSFETMQRDYIIQVLNHTDWRVSGKKGAAVILNMKDKTLFAKMKRLGIEKQVILKK